MKRILAMLITLLMVISLAACDTIISSATTTASTVRTTTAKTTGTTTVAAVTTTTPAGDLLIGCLQDLSGVNSEHGNMINNGVNYAAKLINAQGGINGRRVKVITYDTKSDVQIAINAFNRMCINDQVVAIVGPPVANIGIALAPVSEKYTVPVLGFFIDNRATRQDDGRGAPYKNMFLLQPSADRQGEILAKYAVVEKSLKKIGILYNQENAYSESLANAFKARTTSLGGGIAIEVPYQTADKDFKVMVSKIMAAGVDAIFTPNYPQELVLIVQQARSIGYTGPIICGLDAAQPFITQAGLAANGIIFINNLSFEDDAVKKMVSDIKAATGKTPVNKFFLGVDAMNVLAGVIRQVGPDPVKIRDAVENLQGYQGICGNLSIDPSTHQPKGLTMFIHEITDGKYVAIKPYSAD